MPRHVPENPTAEQRRTLLLGILLTVFIDLLSFGMFIPDIQIRGQHLAANLVKVPISSAPTNDTVTTYLSLIFAAFSISQLIAAPWMGRISDKIGRRPILLSSIFLSICAYLLYSHTDNYWITFCSRILAGFAAANLGVCFAYVSDITSPADRAKGIGLIGAGVGVGFMVGPSFGSWLLVLGKDSPLLLGYVAAGLCLVNFLYVLLLLPESLRPDVRVERESFFTELKIAFRAPGMPLLLGMSFAFNLAFAMLQGTFFRLLPDSRSIFHLTELDAKQQGGWILALVGIFGALTQGVFLPKLLPKFGEVNLLRVGLALTVPGLALLPYSPIWSGIVFVVALQGIGSGLTQPTMSALVSKGAPARIQGGIFGITQSLGAMSRLIGPIAANWLFARNVAWPYWAGALAVLFPLAAAWTLKAPKMEVATA